MNKTIRRILFIVLAAIMMMGLAAPAFASPVKYRGEYKSGKYWYYYRSGKAVKNAFVRTNSKKVYFYNKKGHKVFGQKKINGNWYFFNKKTGAMKTGFVRVNAKNTSYYDQNGRKVYGLRKINGYWYYFNESTGAMAVNCRVYIRAEGRYCTCDKYGHLNYGTPGKKSSGGLFSRFINALFGFPGDN